MENKEHIQKPNLQKKPNLLFWALRAIAAVIMLQTLYFKFTAHPSSVALFESIDMEPYGRIGVGIGEMIAAILLLIPRTTWLGALLTIELMSGAVFFHLTQIGIEGKQGELFLMAIITLVAALILLIGHWKDTPFFKK